MKPVLRTLTLVACLAAVAPFADAQTSSNNPAGRGAHSSFFFGSNPAGPRSEPLGGGLNASAQRNALGRPLPRFGPVTPVPEPTEWAMMLAGLALVGYMVRRGSRR